MMDLFTPQVPEASQHPHFRSIMQYRQGTLSILNKWADGFVDRDEKFVKEFQTTFNSSFWELYLHACFKELGHDIDLAHARPDFLLRDGVLRVCSIEATTANHADGTRPEWKTQGLDDWTKLDIEQIVDAATVRLANAITSKSRLYQTDYAALPHVQGIPFVIAVAPFDGPLSFLQGSQPVRRVLYGYDITKVDDRAGVKAVVGHQFMKSIRKANGTILPLAYFMDNVLEHVSAIVFSNVATFGKVQALTEEDRETTLFVTTRFDSSGLFPRHEKTAGPKYKETLLDGLKVFHNPYAAIPLPRHVFAAPGVAQFSCNLDTGVPETYDLENHLDTRMSLTFRP